MSGGKTFSANKLDREDTKQVSLFFSPREGKAACDSKCSHCLFFRQFEGGQTPVGAGKVSQAIKSFRKSGADVVFLSTSELFLAKNWQGIIRANGDKYVNTNGRRIAKEGQPLLAQIRDAGIEELVLTANFGGSGDLQLTGRDTVEEAFRQISIFNRENPAKAFSVVASIILTRDNCLMVLEACDYALKVCKANIVKFLSLIPLTWNGDMAPTPRQLESAAKQIDAARAIFQKDALFIERSGTLGFWGVDEKRKKRACPAGERMVAVRSLADGSPASPCIFLPDTVIGRMENGKIILESGPLEKFLVFKAAALEQNLCPAYASARR